MRIRDEAPGEKEQLVERAFEIALARRPTASERGRMVQLAADHGLEQVCRVLLNSSEFVYMQ